MAHILTGISFDFPAIFGVEVYGGARAANEETCQSHGSRDFPCYVGNRVRGLCCYSSPARPNRTQPPLPRIPLGVECSVFPSGHTTSSTP